MKSSYLGQNLIFILSQPRSGSTLLQRILFGHPKIQTSAETWLMLHPCYVFRKKGIRTEYNAAFSRIGISDFIENYTDGFEVYDDAIRQWANVIYSNAINKQNKEFFLDKTPRYFFIIKDLCRLFPKAKFIFLLRNPMAVLASELKTYVKGDWPILSTFRADLLEAPKMLINGIQLIGNNAHVVKYEDLVNDPDKEVSKICEYLGFDYYDGMVEYKQTPIPEGRMNDHAGIHRHSRPTTTSINRWKAMAEDPQCQHFALSYLKSLGRDQIRRLGYDYDAIFQVLTGTAGMGIDGSLYPWSMAIRPRSELSLIERYLSDRYFFIRSNGRFIGNCKAVFDGFKKVFRKVKAAGQN